MNDWMGRLPLSTIYRSLFLLGGALAFLGEKLSLPWLTNCALVCVCVLFILVGAELIVTRKAEFLLGGWAYVQGREVFRGLSAQLWGIMFLGLGGLGLTYTLGNWLLPARMDSLLENLGNTSAGAGLALTGLGLIAILYGMIRLLAGSAGLDLGRLTGLSNFLDRTAGCLVLLIGLTLAPFGFLLIVAPDFVGFWIDRIRILLFGS